MLPLVHKKTPPAKKKTRQSKTRHFVSNIHSHRDKHTNAQTNTCTHNTFLHSNECRRCLTIQSETEHIQSTCKIRFLLEHQKVSYLHNVYLLDCAVLESSMNNPKACMK